MYKGGAVKIRRVDVFNLKPGMKVAQAVYSSRGDVLLNAGMNLSASYIEKLVRLGVSFIYVDDGVLPNMAVNDVIALETRTAAVFQVKNILLKSRESGQLVIDPQAIYSTVSEFTDQLLGNDKLVYNLIDLRIQDDYTFAHSVNVAVLSLMTGITLGFDRNQLSALGVGALLHDLGKVKIPNKILNKPGKLTAEEYSLMKEHTTFGHRMIRSAGNPDFDIPAIVAYQHHESYDGSGYPLGIEGGEFHVYAQIAAIADKFDALTANRIYRPAYPPHEAYELCAASGNFWFSDYIVRAFLHNIAAYPTGTWVMLNNGMVAVAVDTPRGRSLFPRVRVIAGKDGLPLAQSFEVSLSERSDLRVVRVLDEEDYHRDMTSL